MVSRYGARGFAAESNLFRGGKCRNAFALHAFKFSFDLRNHRRQRAAAVTRLVLDPIPPVWIVARRDAPDAGGFALTNQQTKLQASDMACR